MAITREFVWDTPTDPDSPSYTYYGWMPAKQPHFDPLNSGFGMCHDVLEHFSDTDETIEHEMLAFGSMLYLRAESDYWAAQGGPSRVVDPGEVMSSDIYNFLYHDTLTQGKTLADPGRTRPLDNEVEDILWRICHHVRKECEGDNGAVPIGLETLLVRACGWMRKGYRKAARRWNLSLNDRLSLWMNCERELDKVVKRMAFDIGDRLIVSVDKQRLTCTYRIVYREDEYPDD